MITVISGTNKKDSKTSIVAKAIHSLLKELGQDTHLINLEDVKVDIAMEDMYNDEKLSEALIKIQDDSIIPAEKVIYVSPEYNGSYAGYLKYFIDVISVRKYKETFANKKCFLVGVAAGRAGNLRGLDHLTSTLNHVGSTVIPGSLPLSQIGSLLTGDGALNEATSDLLKEKLKLFIAY